MTAEFDGEVVVEAEDVDELDAETETEEDREESADGEATAVRVGFDVVVGSPDAETDTEAEGVD